MDIWRKKKTLMGIKHTLPLINLPGIYTEQYHMIIYEKYINNMQSRTSHTMHEERIIT